MGPQTRLSAFGNPRKEVKVKSYENRPGQAQQKFNAQKQNLFMVVENNPDRPCFWYVAKV